MIGSGWASTLLFIMWRFVTSKALQGMEILIGLGSGKEHHGSDVRSKH